VDNVRNPKASVDGCFVYQRKATSGAWLPVRTISLSTLREGDEFKLTLHAEELFALLQALVPLYKFYEQKGIPAGDRAFVEVPTRVAKWVSQSKQDLASLFDADPGSADSVLSRLVNWIATSKGQKETAIRLASVAPEQMPSFAALLGLAGLKEAIEFWNHNNGQNDEQFWQNALSSRAYILSQLFSYPVVIIGEKAFVGGKQITARGGKEVDFLLSAESTDAVLLVEIKTPGTQLLAHKYREGVYPLSGELSGAVIQVLRYKQNLVRNFDSVTSEHPKRLTLGDPKCVIVAGMTTELKDQSSRESFELLRERFQGVTVITFDELFLKLKNLIHLLEGI
jgi:hypothetical protein